MRKLVDIELLVKTIHAEFGRVVDSGLATSLTIGCVAAILKIDTLKALKIVSPILHPKENEND